MRLGWPSLIAWQRAVVVPVSIYAVLTAVSGVFLAIGASRQVALLATSPAYTVKFPTPASPGYFGVMSNWDGQWYRSIAENGYPASLPVSAGGDVLQNEFAFAPGFPLVVRAVMSVTSLDFDHSAWLVSILCGLIAIVLLYDWLARRHGLPEAAAALVALLLAFVSAPVLQVGYSESLTLLLLVVFLRALSRDAYRAATFAGVAVALVRQVAVPLALLMLLHILTRPRVRDAPSWWTERGKKLGYVVLLGAAAGMWPLAAWLTTGRPDAFAATLNAWAAYGSTGGLVGGWLPELLHLSPFGLLATAIMTVYAFVCLRTGISRLGGTLWRWGLIYPAYIFFASRPSSSILRYLLLAIVPLAPFPVFVGREAWPRWLAWSSVTACVAIGLAAQYWWVTHVFTVAGAPEDQPFP